MSEKRYRDLKGQRFGKLVALDKERSNTKSGRAIWLCTCDCGNLTKVLSSNLIHGITKSCGCNKTLGIVTHGMSATAFYHVWQGLKTRCTNANSNKYKYYGAKGIKYDVRWRGFENFYDDMHKSYKEGLTLERINPDSDYTKDNCTWVTYTEQNNNKADNIHLKYNGQIYTVKEAAKKFKVLSTTIYNRRRCGWEDSKILGTPSGR
jgi:hypothetical protein